MSDRTSLSARQIGVGFTVAIVVLSLVPGVAVAQSGAGGTITVEEGETVSEVNAVGGAVIIHGTVTGDVSGAAGNVLITGTVEGDVNVATGNLRITGDVGGNVSAGAGSITLEESSSVGGNFDAGAGNVRINGTIDGDARVGAEVISLGENATIAGSLTYDGQLEGNRDAVAGEITRDRSLGPSSVGEFQPIATGLFAAYAFVANLLFGALLLALFPRFSDSVANKVVTEPVRAGLVGLGVLVAVPLLLGLLAITIVGIPFTLAGTFVFLVVVWIALIYGRFALGMWILSLAAGQRETVGGIHRRWIALVLGLLLGGALDFIPIIGGLLNLVIFLLGLGALSIRLVGRRRRLRAGPSETMPEESPAS